MSANNVNTNNKGFWSNLGSIISNTTYAASTSAVTTAEIAVLTAQQLDNVKPLIQGMGRGARVIGTSAFVGSLLLERELEDKLVEEFDLTPKELDLYDLELLEKKIKASYANRKNKESKSE